MRKMSEPAVTRVVEDYVTLIWKSFEWSGQAPTTTDLAGQLGVTPSTVSATLKKLDRDGFILYEPYGAISLTELGQATAVSMVRRHRIVETYLVRMLNIPWDEVHVEADLLEHAVSDKVLQQMDQALGHPIADPHGDPIPAPDGSIVADHTLALIDVAAGTTVRLARVSDRFPDILRYVDDLAIGVGTALRVESINKAAGVVHVTTGDAALQLSLQAAEALRVQIVGIVADEPGHSTE